MREAAGSFRPGVQSSPIGKLARPELVNAICNFVWNGDSKYRGKAA